MMYIRTLFRTPVHTALFAVLSFLVVLNFIIPVTAVFDGGGTIDGGGGGGTGLPPTASLSATPTSIISGNGSVLSWTSTRAYQCDGTGFNTSGLTSGSVTVYPSTTTTYSVYCYGNNGTDISASRTVTVTAATLAPTVTLNASPTSITSGGSSTLTWSSTNATSCSKNFGSGTATSGSNSVSPGSTTTYTVTCTGTGGSTTQSATVTVSAPPLSVSCSPSVASTQTFQSITWTATPSGGTGSYTYSWSGTQGLTGSTQAVTRSYNKASGYTSYLGGSNNIANPHSATVTVTSGSETKTATCSLNVCAGPDEIVHDGDDNAPYPGNIAEGDEFRCCNNAAVWGASYKNDRVCESGFSFQAPTATLSASPTSVVSGQSATLTYSCTNSTSASINQGVGTLSPVASGTKTVSPGATTTYTLTCTGLGGTATKTATVTFTPETGDPWVNMGCGPINDSYNGSCNPTQEWLDIECDYGEMLQGRSVYNAPQCFPPNNRFKDERRCVVDASCPAACNPDGTVVGTVSPGVYQCTTEPETPGQNCCSGDISYGGGDGTDLNIYCGSVCVPLIMPDLTAGSITPTSATLNTAVTLSSTVSNIGTAATPAGGYTSLFQRATSASGTGATVIGTHVRPTSLGAGATGPATLSYTFTTLNGSNPWYVRACADNNASWVGTVTESNETNNCGAWTAVTIGSPDLTAGAVSPTTATAGTAVTLSSTISNTGTASSGAGFYSLFQRATDASGTGATDIGTYNRTTALSNGGTFSGTLSYTFSSAGTWYVRACADKNSSASTGTITESNETNNCGAWTAVTVSNPTPQCSDGANNDGDSYGADYPSDPGCDDSNDPTEDPNPECSDGVSNDGDGLVDAADPGCTTGDPRDDTEDPNPPTATFSCTSPAGCVISPGGSATLTWNTSGYASCTAVDASGQFTTGGQPDGTDSVSPTATTAYGLTCDGNAIPPVTVTVRQPYAYIEAVPDRVNAGQTASIRYSANQVTTCSVTGTDGYSANPVPDVSLNIATTSVNRTISKQTTYTISCDGGAATSRVIVNTTPQFQEF